MRQARILKIVVASPGDVQAERDMIPAIVDELNKGIADERGVRLEVYRCETDAYPGFHPLGPQGQIDSCLRIEDCDLLIAIFWKRFGTPVLAAQSGTEHEIRLALESCEKMGRPQLMIYFNQALHEPHLKIEKDQWQQVLDFKQTLSQKVLWWEYHSKDQFGDFVRQHLTQFIRGDISGRPLEELLQAYRDHLIRRVSTVRIFGEAETRPLEKVFVELTLTEEYERPTVNAQWLGLMDAELRRRRDIFARDDEDKETGKPEKDREKVKRTLKPDELLRRRTQAVIVGAPGCGKTTLLRYLALKTLQTGKRFPVFLELKSLSEKAFEAAEGNLVELLFTKAIAAPLGFSAAELDRCKAFFLVRLKAGEVTIFLDGLDEVAGAKFFNALCRSVNDFMASAYRNNDLIISTRPYALQHRFESMQEMEIASLTPRQIEAFLQHYYGDDPTIKKLHQELRRRRELREMARVPFLLSVIAYLYRQQAEIVGERLELYRQLVQQLVTQLDREKNIERFYLPDPDGSLKREFLKQLAYERLFVDEVDKEAERLILTGEVIATKARTFCQTHLTTNPHLLAADVKATPLLREIGADAYAFSHLTLQEYLAAVALAEQSDCEKTFCRAYFNPTLAEMEVLPMALGLVRNPDDFYAALEGLPESLNFANLRMRARGLAYVHKISEEYLTKLTDQLIEFIAEKKAEETPYNASVFSSYSKASGKTAELILDRVAELLYHKNPDVSWRAAYALGEIGSEVCVDALAAALQDKNRDVRYIATEALGKIGSEASVEALLAALKDEDRYVRYTTAQALGQIGSKRSIDALTATLKDEDVIVSTHAAAALVKIGSEHSAKALLAAFKGENSHVRGLVAFKLCEIGNEASVEALLAALKDEDSFVRECVVETLAQIGSEHCVEALATALRDKDSVVRWHAAQGLGQLGSERSVEALLTALKDEDRSVRANAAEGLRKIGSEASVEALLVVLKDEDSHVRGRVAEALGEIGRECSVEVLAAALKDKDSVVRWHAAQGLGQIGSERSVEALLAALKDEDSSVREKAAEALGKIGSERNVEALLVALKDEYPPVRWRATEALGKIDSERSVDVLLVALKDEYPPMRWRAAEALGKIGSERSVEALRVALKDEDRNVRWNATEALGKIGSERSVEALVAALKDEDSSVRRSVAQALVRMSDAALVNGLARALSYNNSFVRQKAAQVVGYYTIGKQLLATLQHIAANDPAEEVRTAAREAAEKYANKLRYFAS
jgi:HEAT repeat protein